MMTRTNTIVLFALVGLVGALGFLVVQQTADAEADSVSVVKPEKVEAPAPVVQSEPESELKSEHEPEKKEAAAKIPTLPKGPIKPVVAEDIAAYTEISADLMEANGSLEKAKIVSQKRFRKINKKVIDRVIKQTKARAELVIRIAKERGLPPVCFEKLAPEDIKQECAKHKLLWGVGPGGAIQVMQ
jgi:hypothetical protein